MIPDYLVGKSATQIIGEMRHRIMVNYVVDSETAMKEYYEKLEGLLLLAVKDALMNADEVKELTQEGEYQAQQRAIVFLNMVLPKKK